MTLPTYDSAQDEILGLFNTDWTALTPAVTGGAVPDVDWPGQDRHAQFDPEKPWARVSLRYGPSRQITFGPVLSRRFNRVGTVSVQVFEPLSSANDLSLGSQLAIIARDAFEGRSTASGIWFRNARITPIGADGAWYQTNVVVEFQYDEMR